jgi:hypothetical protein
MTFYSEEYLDTLSLKQRQQIKNYILLKNIAANSTSNSKTNNKTNSKTNTNNKQILKKKT